MEELRIIYFDPNQSTNTLPEIVEENWERATLPLLEYDPVTNTYKSKSPTIDEQLDTVIETDILNNMILENTQKFQEKYIPDLIELEDLLKVRRILIAKFCDKIIYLYNEMGCNNLADQFYATNQEHLRITVAMIDMIEINKMSFTELEKEIAIHMRGRFDSFPNEMAVEEYDRYHTVLLKRREEIIIRRLMLALEKQNNMIHYNEMIKNNVPIVEDIPIHTIPNKQRKIRNVMKNNSRKNLMRSNRRNMSKNRIIR